VPDRAAHSAPPRSTTAELRPSDVDPLPSRSARDRTPVLPKLLTPQGERQPLTERRCSHGCSRRLPSPGRLPNPTRSHSRCGDDPARARCAPDRAVTGWHARSSRVTGSSVDEGTPPSRPATMCPGGSLKVATRVRIPLGVPATQAQVGGYGRPGPAVRTTPLIGRRAQPAPNRAANITPVGPSA
jgi:hypothetical protein